MHRQWPVYARDVIACRSRWCDVVTTGGRERVIPIDVGQAATAR